MIAQLPFFLQLKTWLVAVAGVTADAMHIYLGTLCFLVSVSATKHPLRWRTLIPVFVLAGLAEVFDLYYDAVGTGILRLTESAHDVVNTSLIPVLMFALLRIFAGSENKITKPNL